jgi:hypothetical protein
MEQLFDEIKKYNPDIKYVNNKWIIKLTYPRHIVVKDRDFVCCLLKVSGKLNAL